MRVIVTGITGFIGGELARKLLNEGHEVYGFVQHVIGRSFESIEDIMGRLSLVTCDIRDYYSVENSIQKIQPDVVIHLAALSPVRLSFEHPFDFQDSNFRGTINMAEALRKLYGPQKVRLIVASTAEVYGLQKRNEPFTEEMTLDPSSPYAVSKAALDMYLRMLYYIYDFNVVILRNSNTFGRKYDNGFVTEYLISEMIKGNEIYIGAPDSIRDYMYVDDHVNSYLLAMKVQEAKGQVFNIAGGKGYTNREWTLKIAELLNFPKSKIHFGEYPPWYPKRPIKSDQPYLVLDNLKAQKYLGWRQTVSLEEGLMQTINHWKKKIANSEKGSLSEQAISKIKELLNDIERKDESGYGFSR